MRHVIGKSIKLLSLFWSIWRRPKTSSKSKILRKRLNLSWALVFETSGCFKFIVQIQFLILMRFLHHKFIEVRIYLLICPVFRILLFNCLHVKLWLTSNLFSFCNKFISTVIDRFRDFLFSKRNYCFNCRVIWYEHLDLLDLMHRWFCLCLCSFWRLFFLTSTSSFVQLCDKLRNSEF